MKNLILFLIALFLVVKLSPFLIIIGIIISMFTQSLPSYYYRSAVELDIVGNVLGGPLFNLILLNPFKKDKILFGQKGMTISKCLGLNKQAKTLSWLGYFIAWVLNVIDKDHVEKAAKIAGFVFLFGFLIIYLYF